MFPTKFFDHSEENWEFSRKQNDDNRIIIYKVKTKCINVYLKSID